MSEIPSPVPAPKKWYDDIATLRKARYTGARDALDPTTKIQYRMEGYNAEKICVWTGSLVYSEKAIDDEAKHISGRIRTYHPCTLEKGFRDSIEPFDAFNAHVAATRILSTRPVTYEQRRMRDR